MGRGWVIFTVTAISAKSSARQAARLPLEDYKSGDGEYAFHGTGEFTPEDGYELYLSTQHFDYTILICEETRTVRRVFSKKKQIRYEATVMIHDTYNFDTLRGWKGVGDILNNLAYISRYGRRNRL